jgi:hypothetical protein
LKTTRISYGYIFVEPPHQRHFLSFGDEQYEHMRLPLTFGCGVTTTEYSCDNASVAFVFHRAQLVSVFIYYLDQVVLLGEKADS